MFSKKTLRYGLIFYLLLPFYLFADVIDIFIRDDVYLSYQKFLAKRDVLEITEFTGSSIRRDVVDLVLAQQALHLGGFKHTYRFIPGKVNFRNTKMLQTGQLLMSFDSYWHSDAVKISRYAYQSPAIIRKGEYHAGIYTSPANQHALGIKTISDFSRLTAVSTPKWRTDWTTLESLNLKELVQEDEWLSMARMVNIGWVDFMLIPFDAATDKSFTLQSIKLVPVPNIAVLLNDSRHFVISKNHQLGKAAYHAIQNGLNQLRRESKIVKAYTEAGFFIDQKKYIVVNKPQQ